LKRLVSRLGVAATVLAAAAWFVAFRLGDRDGRGLLAHDVYAYFYPNVLYAAARLRAGGEGLLWNPYQNCGAPFFGSSQTGLLYPANLFFLFLDPGHALRAALLSNLVVGGALAYLLCRELGAGRVAALAGALAFELGNASVRLTTWAPMLSAPFAWLPGAMLFCERLIRAPRARDAVALGGVLTLALLPGYPQTVLFAYQLIALRVLWEFATARVARPARVLGALAVGLGLPVLLAAVQILPAVEVARLSARPSALSLAEMSPLGFLGWKAFRMQLGLRSAVQTPFILVPCLVAAAALVGGSRRRIALFYLLAGTVYLLLAFGPNTPLFALYLALPLGATFREPIRFMWVPSFCLAVLAALGVEALARPRAGAAWRRIPIAAAPLAALIGFFLLSPSGLSRPEGLLAALVLAGVAIAAVAPGAARAAAPVLLLAVIANPILAPSMTWQRLLADDTSLYRHAPLFARLRARMGPQDRMYLIHDAPEKTDYALMRKSASLFEVPSIHDYDPQPSRRYAELFIMLRKGRPMVNLNDVYYIQDWAPELNRRLLDLTAVRYLVVAASVDQTSDAMRPPVQPVDADAEVRVYENPQALPRARWVPRIEVVPDASLLLARLAAGPDDLRQVALIEGSPPTGFAGTPGDAADASSEIVEDRPEHVVVRVHAPARGFLFLADQHFPGWDATVDGRPVPVLRADHAFRLVEVPAGESTVDFRYAPASLRLGAAISAATLLGVTAVLLLPLRRARRRTTAPAPAVP